MLTGPNVILILKVAVAAVTLLLLVSFVPLARGNYRLHGRINMGFFALTVSAVLGLELVVRIIEPGIFNYFDAAARQRLNVHLCFSLPSTALLLPMLFTGLTRRRRTHLTLAALFGILWTGTFITGIFFLPHAAP